MSEPLLEKLRAAQATGDWNVVVGAIPYLAFLGVRVESREGRLVGRMPFSGHLVGNPLLPALHGGTLATLLESAAHFELLFNASTTTLPKTITVTIDYLRSARPVDTFVSARVFKQGRRVCTLHVTAWQDDEAKPVASATVQLLILGREGPPPAP